MFDSLQKQVSLESFVVRSGASKTAPVLPEVTLLPDSSSPNFDISDADDASLMMEFCRLLYEVAFYTPSVFLTGNYTAGPSHRQKANQLHWFIAQAKPKDAGIKALFSGSKDDFFCKPFIDVKSFEGIATRLGLYKKAKVPDILDGVLAAYGEGDLNITYKEDYKPSFLVPDVLGNLNAAPVAVISVSRKSEAPDNPFWRLIAAYFSDIKSMELGEEKASRTAALVHALAHGAVDHGLQGASPSLYSRYTDSGYALANVAASMYLEYITKVNSKASRTFDSDAEAAALKWVLGAEGTSDIGGLAELISDKFAATVVKAFCGDFRDTDEDTVIAIENLGYHFVMAAGDDAAGEGEKKDDEEEGSEENPLAAEPPATEDPPAEGGEGGEEGSEEEPAGEDPDTGGEDAFGTDDENQGAEGEDTTGGGESDTMATSNTGVAPKGAKPGIPINQGVQADYQYCHAVLNLYAALAKTPGAVSQKALAQLKFWVEQWLWLSTVETTDQFLTQIGLIDLVKEKK